MATPTSSNKSPLPNANAAEDGGSRSSNTVEIQFFKSGTVPPVFVATSFSLPPWAPFEMTAKEKESLASPDKPVVKEYRFSKGFDGVPNGIHHYKFRLGNGDWWTTAEDQKTATDEHGNKNNVLNAGVIKSEHPKEDVVPPSDVKSFDGKVAMLSPSGQFPETATSPKPASVPEEKKTLGDTVKSATASAATAISQIPAAATAMTSIAPKKSEDQTAVAAAQSSSGKAGPGAEAQGRPLPTPASHASEPQVPLKDAPKSALASVMKMASETPLPASPAPRVHDAEPKHDNPIHPEHHHASPSPPASRRLADTAAEVADTASMLDRSGTPTPASKKPLDHQKLSAEEEHAKHTVRALTQLRSRMDVLLDDAHSKGLMIHDVDHITENEPGHFPQDNATEASSLRRRLTGATANRIQEEAKPAKIGTGSPRQADENAFPWSFGPEILAGLVGGFVGTVLASLVMWMLFGRR